MSQYTRECPNCGANVAISFLSCDRCGERWDEPGTGRPHFSTESREAGQNMGGLLKLYDADGVSVRSVGWCPAGAFGMDEAGRLVWVEDWEYMTGLEVQGSELTLAGKRADIESGRLLIDE